MWPQEPIHTVTQTLCFYTATQVAELARSCTAGILMAQGIHRATFFPDAAFAHAVADLAGTAEAAKATLEYISPVTPP